MSCVALPLVLIQFLSNEQHCVWDRQTTAHAGTLSHKLVWADRRMNITWHVAHAAQNGPGFDIEGPLPLTEALVNKTHHLIRAQVTSEQQIKETHLMYCRTTNV